MFGKGNDTARRGLATHLAVARRLVEKGYEVLQPFGDYLRYDLASYIPADNGQEAYLIRIQCKTARISKDQSYLNFNTSNMTGGRRERRGYREDVEYFGVYSPDTCKVYLIPAGVVPQMGQAYLRLKKAKNNQEKGIIWANDYEL